MKKINVVCKCGTKLRVSKRLWKKGLQCPKCLCSLNSQNNRFSLLGVLAFFLSILSVGLTIDFFISLYAQSNGNKNRTSVVEKIIVVMTDSDIRSEYYKIVEKKLEEHTKTSPSTVENQNSFPSKSKGTDNSSKKSSNYTPNSFSRQTASNTENNTFQSKMNDYNDTDYGNTDYNNADHQRNSQRTATKDQASTSPQTQAQNKTIKEMLGVKEKPKSFGESVMDFLSKNPEIIELGIKASIELYKHSQQGDAPEGHTNVRGYWRNKPSGGKTYVQPHYRKLKK